MKKYILIVSSSFLLTAFITNRLGNKEAFKKLYILEGKWQMKTKRGVIGEEWQIIDKNYLQSRGYFLEDDDTITTERVALRNRNEGIFYSSIAEGQNDGKAIDFKLTSADTEKMIFVFENPKHDFPKRIVYEFINPDSLQAYIDNGGANVGNKRQEFYYSKVK